MAAASQAAEESEMLLCPVCVTKFDNPRVLPCLHSICEKCLRVNIESRGQSSTQFMCPICKTPTVPSDGGFSVREWTSEFIPNNTIKTMVDTAGSPDHNEDDRCDECQREGENAIAEVWCMDCKENLCCSCLKSHTRNKVTRHHTTVSVNEVGETCSATCIKFERSCTQHPGKLPELFCVDHRVLCCVVCFASNHRKCKNVRDIDDVVKEQAKKFSCSKVLEDLTRIKTEMNKVIKDKNENAVQLSQKKETIIDDMDSLVDRIIAKLNELRKSFRDEAVQLHKDGELSILKCHKVIQGFIANIDNSCKVLANLRDKQSPQQIFIMFETIRSQFTSYHQQLKDNLKDDAKVYLTVKPNKVLQDMEKSLDSLGVVEVTLKTNKVMEDSLNKIDEDIRKLNSRTDLSTQMCAGKAEKSDTMTSSVTLVKTVTRQNLGTNTYITGGAFLGDGRLVMADYKNSRLLQMDDDFNIVRAHKMYDRVIDVAAGKNQNEIYISLYSSIYHCSLSPDTRLTIKQSIKAPDYFWGIAVSGDTIIAGAAADVSLLLQDGSTVKAVAKAPSDSYVAVLHTSPSFYYGDEDSVVSRTFDGKELFRYTNDKLKYVTGICVHNNDVYVCGTISQNVHQISCDGQKSRILLDKLHSISQPCAVLFNQQKNELIVTSYDEDTVLEVYRLN